MEKTASPCVSLCLLNDQDVCKGCFRTSDEIQNWVYFNDEQRQEIIENCSERANAD